MSDNLECGHPAGCELFDRYDEDTDEPIGYCGWCYAIERKDEYYHRVTELIEARLDWREAAALIVLSPGIHDIKGFRTPHNIIVRRGAVVRVGDGCTIDTLNLHGGTVGMRRDVADICTVTNGVQKP